MRLIYVTICVILLALITGCSDVPELILTNGTSSSIEVAFQSGVESVPPGTSLRLRGVPFDTRIKSCDAVIIRNDKHYGYLFDPNVLAHTKVFRHRMLNPVYYFAIKDDGNLYLASPEKPNTALLTQPAGFPIKPAVVN